MFGFWHRTSRAEVNGVSIGRESSVDPETCSFITQAFINRWSFFLITLTEFGCLYAKTIRLMIKTTSSHKRTNILLLA